MSARTAWVVTGALVYINGDPYKGGQQVLLKSRAQIEYLAAWGLIVPVHAGAHK